MNPELHLKLIAFIRKVERRGLTYLFGTVTYYWRRHWYFLRIRIQGKSFHRECFSRFCSKKQEMPGRCLTGAHFRERGYPKFHFDSADLPEIIRSVPESLKSQVIAESETILKQRFNFRGIAAHAFDADIDWQYAAGNNITWLWDLNRHFYLPGLARSYYYTGEKKYIDKLIDLWSDWIEKNAARDAINWAAPFEVAARLNNWIWCFFLLVYADDGHRAPYRQFLDSLYRHADYLYANLELNWPNNHLLLEAKALLEFAMLFPELDRQQKFLNRAAGIFARETKAQILADGGHSELCSMYHLIVAGELLEIFLLSGRNNFCISGLTVAKIRDMAVFCDALVRQDGSIPRIGDSANDDNYIRFALVERRKSDLNYWVRDQNAIRPDDPEDIEKNLTLKCFSRSGYAVITERSMQKNVHIVFDFGDFSKNPASDHAHCDALSFELWADGKALIIDPGVYFPLENKGRWHRYFRSTRAHNTLMVDDMEQSQLWRHSDVRTTADVKLVKADVDAKQVVLEALCRPYWSKGEARILHRRQLAYGPGRGMRISDRVEGTGTHNLKWFFHLAPGIEIRNETGRLTGFDHTAARLFTLYCERQDGPGLQITRGGTDPLTGWASLNAFHVLPVNCITYSVLAQLPYACEFCIHIHDEPGQ